MTFQDVAGIDIRLMKNGWCRLPGPGCSAQFVRRLATLVWQLRARPLATKSTLLPGLTPAF